VGSVFNTATAAKDLIPAAGLSGALAEGHNNILHYYIIKIQYPIQILSVNLIVSRRPGRLKDPSRWLSRMDATDERGVLANYQRNAAVADLITIICEIIANRRHQPITGPVKFLFAQFVMEGKPYFILGSTQYRSKQSIEKEHTPYTINVPVANSQAHIGTRGFGAKLFPFHMGGQYSNLYQVEDTEAFPGCDDMKWGLKDWINMKKLTEAIVLNRTFNPNDYRSKYYETVAEMPDTKPFLFKPEFRESPLYSFLETHNLKYFYVFCGYTLPVLVKLEEQLKELAKFYEINSEVELYRSVDLKLPTLICCKRSVPSPYALVDSTSIGYGILQTMWSGALIFDWRIGAKQDLYYKSEYCIQFMDGNLKKSDTKYYGRLDSNGSKDTKKFGIRSASFTPPEGWTPQVRITVGITKPDYEASLSKSDRHSNMIYLMMEGDLISRQATDSELNGQLRHLKKPSRIRLLVDILEESLKTNADAGLITAEVKYSSKIETKRSIHEMIKMSVSRAKIFLNSAEKKDSEFALPSTFANTELIESMKKEIEMDKKNNERSSKRKREAIKFESTVANYLKEFDFDTEIEWMEGDAKIMEEHGLEGQGIDILGSYSKGGNTVWIPIQCKDRENGIRQDDITSFESTIRQLRTVKTAVNSNDTLLPLLVLAKQKSFNYELYHKLCCQSIVTIIDDTTAHGVKTAELIQSRLNLD